MAVISSTCHTEPVHVMISKRFARLSCIPSRVRRTLTPLLRRLLRATWGQTLTPRRRHPLLLYPHLSSPPEDRRRPVKGVAGSTASRSPRGGIGGGAPRR
jgi:hypothetical protein